MLFRVPARFPHASTNKYKYTHILSFLTQECVHTALHFPFFTQQGTWKILRAFGSLLQILFSQTPVARPLHGFQCSLSNDAVIF